MLSSPVLILTEPRARWARTSTSELKGPARAVVAKAVMHRSMYFIVRKNNWCCNDCPRAGKLVFALQRKEIDSARSDGSASYIYSGWC